MPHSSPLIPCLRYADPKAAIRFLTEAFGFVEKAVHAGPDGAVMHAELSFGEGEAPGLLMLGGATRPFHDMRLPQEAGGVTDCLYLLVADPDAHCARARAAGATILEDPVDRDYGARDYVARDPEGYLWSFGTYDPWKA